MSEASPESRVQRPGFFERALRTVLRLFFRLLWWCISRAAIAVAAIVGIATLTVLVKLPAANDLLDGRQRGSVTLLDVEGNVFAWRGQQGGTILAGEVSPHLHNAVVATEDKRFYTHLGISPRGVASAIRINLREGRGPLSGHGGSTITQQVAKLVFLSDRSTYERKLLEIPYAFAMELKYTKAEILSIYLNRAYLGAASNGFEAASQRYFSKSAREVSPAEAAMLAGLLKAPSRYAPTTNLARAQGRGGVIINLMEAQGYLTADQAKDARENPAQLSEAAQARAGVAFSDWVMEAGPSFLTDQSSEDVHIFTTFDPWVQSMAEEALAHVFDSKVKEGSKAQAAIVVLAPDGAIRAMVGGRQSGLAGNFNRATQALRQPGSAFKPFIYAAALENGRSPYDIEIDAPVTFDIPGSGLWSPRNYTKDFRGPMTLEAALSQSINTIAVRLSEQVGRDRVKQVARGFGLNGPFADGPALALGVSETTLLDLTAAYAGFLNEGRAVEPFGFTDLRLSGDDIPILSGKPPSGKQIISAPANAALVQMLTKVVQDGTGGRAQLDRPVAGKTGTTQGARDAWFIGFTGTYVTGVWMGYDDNSPLTGVTGGGLPAEIWREVMQRIHQNEALAPIPLPDPPLLRPNAPSPALPEPSGDPEADMILFDILNRFWRGDGTPPEEKEEDE